MKTILHSFAFLLFALMTLSSTNSFALEKVIAVVTNDEGPKVYKLVLESDEDQTVIQNFYRDTYLNNKLLERLKLNLSLITTTGMILEKKDKLIVINLKCENFDNQLGGDITIDTLKNGISKNRQDYHMSLVKKHTGGWELLNNKKEFSKIIIKLNKAVFIGIIGIKNLILD